MFFGFSDSITGGWVLQHKKIFEIIKNFKISVVIYKPSGNSWPKKEIIKLVIPRVICHVNKESGFLNLSKIQWDKGQPVCKVFKGDRNESRASWKIELQKENASWIFRHFPPVWFKQYEVVYEHFSRSSKSES